MVKCWKPESFLASFREARELLPRCTNGFVPVVVWVEFLGDVRGCNLVFAQPADWRRERLDGDYRFVPICRVAGGDAAEALARLALLVAAHRPAVEKLTDSLQGAAQLMQSTAAASVVEAVEIEAKRRALAELR